MYRFLFIGADARVFSKLNTGLPLSMTLQMVEKK